MRDALFETSQQYASTIEQTKQEITRLQEQLDNAKKRLVDTEAAKKFLDEKIESLPKQKADPEKKTPANPRPNQ